MYLSDVSFINKNIPVAPQCSVTFFHENSMHSESVQWTLIYPKQNNTFYQQIINKYVLMI